MLLAKFEIISDFQLRIDVTQASSSASKTLRPSNFCCQVCRDEAWPLCWPHFRLLLEYQIGPSGGIDDPKTDSYQVIQSYELLHAAARGICSPSDVSPLREMMCPLLPKSDASEKDVSLEALPNRLFSPPANKNRSFRRLSPLHQIAGSYWFYCGCNQSRSTGPL
jgi:hypothetical protein